MSDAATTNFLPQGSRFRDELLKVVEWLEECAVIVLGANSDPRVNGEPLGRAYPAFVQPEFSPQIFEEVAFGPVRNDKEVVITFGAGDQLSRLEPCAPKHIDAVFSWIPSRVISVSLKKP